MGKKVAIIQSGYIPWKGYFDIINRVDLFIFHDDLQYTKQDWRNRNKIKTHQGLRWLTIPCGSNEKRLICEVELNNHSWQEKHWQIIYENYHRAPYFNERRDFFEDFYKNHKWKNLSQLNQYLIKNISCKFLNISTEFDDSRNYDLKEKKASRVIELLLKAQADEYISGPSAKTYLSEKDFEQSSMKLVWMDYNNYPEYTQIHGPFEHQVSILDTLFNLSDKSLSEIINCNLKLNS